jgi:hypothetical protein
MTSKRLRRPTGTANVGILEAGLARSWLRLKSRSYESHSRLASNAHYLSALGEVHLDWSAGFVAEVVFRSHGHRHLRPVDAQAPITSGSKTLLGRPGARPASFSVHSFASRLSCS